MEENVDSELGDHYRRAEEAENRSYELQFESSNRENSEDPERNDFSMKLSESRVFSTIGSNNAARYKLMSPARLPITRSPCLTIPPGLSPTTLLDSPVLLSNMKAEPSPTTGTFNKPQIMYDTVVSDGFSSPRDSCNSNAYDGISSGTFEFKPHVRSTSGSGLSSMGSMPCGGSGNQQDEPFGQVQGLFQTTNFSSALSVDNMPASSHELTLTVAAPNPSGYLVASRAIVPAEVASEEMMRKQVSDSGAQESQSDHKETSPSIAADRSSEDGYNWRKYGQKHVKGCEFPRSYYKCTHPNCQVKKQLERSHDGQITEIIYKGKHDHPKPQPSRRMAVGTIVSAQEEGSDRFSSLNNAEDKLSSAYGNRQIQPNGSPEFFPVTAVDDNVDGTGAPSNGITNEVEDDDDDDPEAKRRKKDTGGNGMDVTLMGKATREPRVVVQTLSEVDILDDGYRWRKYGQKVVKGNPNPRSYYKCTNAGCPVRKHVERASHDPKAVITTYEGKHNHDVPAARTSAHDTAGPTLYHTAPNSMLRTRSEEIDTISLDLGVGINSSPENRSNEMQQTMDAEPLRSYSYIPDPGSSRMIQAYSGNGGDQYGSRQGNGGDQYGSRQGVGESFSFETQPLNHPSNPYQQNMGRLMMGP
ncbi:Wrky transcription factor susiba2 [Thalictrum thalictroides]|uniref:Wrky transcription factor susiba2 n=1 Tax=Thalictrum thalictroides TaxID=46969 RepID=A0A7J6UZ88_THATH|nr:Wrky transcription factor susiba2 [Thalictrum thalictroides]